jgi:hypothetical protein
MFGSGTFDFETGANQYSKIIDALTNFNVNKHIDDYQDVTDFASIAVDGSTYTLNKTIANFTSVYDNISLVSISQRAYADTVNSNESLVTSSVIAKSDSTITIDSLSRTVQFNRIFNDVIYGDDILTPRLFQSNANNQYEFTNVDDQFSRVVSFNRTFNDTVYINDDPNLRVFNSETYNQFDNTNVNDQFSRVVSFNRTFNDSVYISDDPNLRLFNSEAYNQFDSTNTSDQFSRVVSFNRTFNDITYSSDTLSHRSTFVRYLSDNINVNDNIIPTLIDGVGELYTDTIGVNSSGVLYIQNYASELYFAEDYTGSSYTFV